MNVKSFSLLEVAFVLTISGIIISFGMRGCFEILETKKMEKTEATINAYKISLLKSICQKEKNLPNPPTDAWGKKTILCLSTGKNFTCSNRTLSFDPCKTTYVETSVKANKLWKNIVAVIISLGSNHKLDSKISKRSIEIKEDDVWDALSLYRVKDQCCQRGNLILISTEIPPIIEGETYDFPIVIKGGDKPYKCKFSPPPEGLKIQTKSDGYCYIVYSGNKVSWNSYDGYIEVTDANGKHGKFRIALTVIREKQ